MEFEGQLWPAERAALHEEVRARRPSLVLEVGTWYGGGSTAQIVGALARNGHGHLHSCEVDKEAYDRASVFYPPGDTPVTLHFLHSSKLIERLIAAGTVPDF